MAAHGEAHDLNLRLYEGNPTAGETRRPTFWVHAEVFTLGEENVWLFEQAHAMIYGHGEKGSEITIDAGRGRFQEGKAAYLKDGVTAQVGDMHIDLTDLEWINDERMARTDNPVSVTSPDSNMKASTLRLYPDQKQLLLTRVSGTVKLERNEP